MRTPAWDAWTERARAVRIEDEAARRGIRLNGGAGKNERCGPCPQCGGEDRFSINTKKQVFNCRGCGKSGDAIALVEFLDGVDFVRACETLTGEPAPKSNGKDRAADGARKVVVGTYSYRDADGAVALVVVRFEYRLADGSFVMKDGKHKKSFLPRRPDPDRPGEWIWDTEGVAPLIYRLPEVTEAIAAGHTILIVEGEAKANLLWSWNVPATCCPGGAERWKAEHSEFLRGADVVILPDNDLPGRKHGDAVARSLAGIAARMRILELPDLPPKGDIINWASAGHVRKELDALIERAPDYSAGGSTRDDMDGGGATKTTTGHDVRPPMFSDDALALRFADQHVGDLRYVADWGKWLSWDGARWQIDRTLAVFDRARAICRAAAAGCNKPKLAKELASARTRAAVVSMAREDRRLAATVEQWDAKPWFFNTGDQHE
jgi:putative DNA primase/helicase